MNGDLPATHQPFVASHELAHLRGFAREDEANFIGFLVTSLSEDPEIRYSGELAALDYLMNARRGHELWKELDPRVRDDLQAWHEFWAGARESRLTVLMTGVATTTNDLYLKSHGHADGVRTYDRMVELLVAYHEAEGPAGAPESDE